MNQALAQALTESTNIRREEMLPVQPGLRYRALGRLALGRCRHA